MAQASNLGKPLASSPQDYLQQSHYANFFPGGEGIAGEGPGKWTSPASGLL